MTFPTLYHKARTGAIHSWELSVDGAIIISVHGLVNGQKITSQKRAEAKNVGRSNATTDEQQALIEAKAMHKHKLDRKYSLTPAEAKEDVLLPMLAQPFAKREKKLTYPVMAQPKFDGVRAIARWEGDEVVLISRQGKLWEATAHLNLELEQVLPKGMVLDGEIYLHGKPLQWISSRTKKKQEGTELLEFHVYDMPEDDEDEDLRDEDRQLNLSTFFIENDALLRVGHIKQATTHKVMSRAEVDFLHDQYVEQGYEGLIVRLLDGVYEYGHRSSSLLKVKAFSDSEFIIVGHTDGKGIEEGLVIWVCKNDTNDLTFETRPRGTHAERRELFNHAKDFYKRSLTVRFIGRNDSGLPHHAVGIAIREPEDM